jgi:hypothetical protein
VVAAPVFAQIAQYELRRLGIPPAVPPQPAPPAQPAANVQQGRTSVPVAPGGANGPTPGPPTTLPGSTSTRNSP